MFSLQQYFTMSSCGGDDDDYEKKEKRVNLVEYKVFCNNPIAHIEIWDGRDIPEVGDWNLEFFFFHEKLFYRVKCYM